jgi:hypothetical protein
MKRPAPADHLKVVVVVSVVVLLAACSGSSGGETATTSGDGLLSEAFGPGDFMLPDPLVGLTDLSGYRSSLTVAFEGSLEGEPQQWTSTSEMLRTADPTAAQLTVANTGDLPAADPSYLVETSGTEYRRDPAGTCIAAVADPNRSLATLFEPAGGLAGVMGADSLGERVIGGIATVGYEFDERAVGQAGIADASGEVWVATDGGYIVEYTMTSEAPTSLGGGRGHSRGPTS